MLANLLRALPAGAVAVVLPGYFWAAVLRPTRGLGERLAYSTALSMAMVPVVAVILARAAGSGIELWVALVSVLMVFGSGALVYWRRGGAPGSTGPVLPPPLAVRSPRALGLTAIVLVVALFDLIGNHLPQWLPWLVGLGVAAVGVLMAWPTATLRPTDPEDPPETDTLPGRHRTPQPDEPPQPALPTWLDRAWLPDTALGAVLGLTLFITYEGVARFDWPFVRGGDQFSHAVMAEQMLVHGQYHAYLVYPPGFSALTAVVCRFAGLTPLALFPVLAPALLVLAPLAAYALASRLWGWGYGLCAALLSGLVLTGAYDGFAEGRYPDLVSAYFLLVMGVAALVGFYQSPSLRSGALVAVVGASPVFYHSVASQYLVVLVALVGVAGVILLVREGRPREVRTLALALAAVGVLAFCYAAYVYDLPGLISGHSATSKAVSIALGTQAAPPVLHLLHAVSAPVVWFGLIGFIILAFGLRRLKEPSQVLAALTVVLWCVFMYLGSRTAVDGFPQRFERDFGGPLTVVGALGLGVVVRSLVHGWRDNRGKLVRTATAAAAVSAVLVVIGFANTVVAENKRSNELVDASVAAAGNWLAAHNTGGNVISTPYMNPGVTNRGVLGMGWYTGLQAYSPRRIKNPRSLPTAGLKPLLDSQEVLLHPTSCPAVSILASDDIRYVVLYYKGPEVDRAAFASDPSRYRRVFHNRSVTVYVPSHAPCAG
ncbi:MAG TPA: hypothetical protein VGS19_04765 [Streptosporangiaceae bacterium]|nr:hypothetical protein [Streptosporangiaceae bacterium]